MSETNDVERRIIRLWLARPADQRTGTHLMFFHNELERAGWPELQDFRPSGDTYEALKPILRDYISRHR